MGTSSRRGRNHSLVAARALRGLNPARAVDAVRGWQLWRQPPRLIAAVLTVSLAGLAVVGTSLAMSSFPAGTLVRDVLVLGLATVFEEVSRNVARLRKRLVDTGHEDMTSVWQFAAAAALPVGHAVAICLGFRAYMWLRHDRRFGKHGFRESFNAGNYVLAVAGASLVVHALSGVERGSVAFLGAIAVGMATYLVINRLLVFGVICLANAKLNLRVLIGTASEIGFEAGTLSLGGLTALALSVQPALAVLALLPTYALQRGALVRELEVAASQDPKTGLLNPVAWQTLAKRELSRAAREDHPATVLIIDLDHFKLVNDGWGHVVGDAVLRGVAQCLREELRDYDTIGRFGGEEFVAMLPDVDELHGALIAERLRVRVGDLLIATCAESVNAPIVAALLEQRLSASIGVACFPEHGLELEHLLVGADAALYRAKDRGRNRVEFAGGPELGPRERIGD